jgi:hypothetical protein
MNAEVYEDDSKDGYEAGAGLKILISTCTTMLRVRI